MQAFEFFHDLPDPSLTELGLVEVRLERTVSEHLPIGCLVSLLVMGRLEVAAPESFELITTG